MTSPDKAAPVSQYTKPIDPVISPFSFLNYLKWGGPTGTTADISYSFPWTSSSTAIWSANYGAEPTFVNRAGFDANQRQAFRDALSSWSDVANIKFTETAETSTNVGDIRIAFSDTMSRPSGALAYATPPYASLPRSGDIWFSWGYAKYTDSLSSGYNYLALVHEIGHSLGLNHPGSAEKSGVAPFLPEELDRIWFTVMTYAHETVIDSTKGGAVHPSTPMVYDILAIQYMYGANTSYHTGNDKYTFDPAVPFFKTIWDAGGNDTIDVSNFTLDCSINLTPGAYSKIAYPKPANPANATNNVVWYDGTNALGIAFGAIIENVVGSKGNDTIQGNDANNTITCGYGNDTVCGGAGNDTLDGGNGTDLATYSGKQSDYVITKLTGSCTVKDTRTTTGNDGFDTLIGFEKLVFSDSTFTLVDPPPAPNSRPTGSVTVSPASSIYQGQTLTANNTLADVDGMGAISYQWRAGYTDIAGATNSTLVLDESLVGKSISVTARYTDARGIAESSVSTATAVVINVNDKPVGNVTISGTAAQGQTLTVSTTLTDLDGMGYVTYQWKENGNVIKNATNNTYVLADAQVGKVISVEAKYTDGHGTVESIVSGALGPVENVNDNSIGAVKISGAPVLGQMLSVTNTLTDADGLGAVAYLWTADGINTGVTGETLSLTTDFVGRSVAVTASYLDGHGTRESVSSKFSIPIIAPTFSGTAAADILNGSSDSESFYGGAGNDLLDGGKGIDTAVFTGNLADYVITKTGSTYTVRDKAGTDGTDTVSNIESMKFADKNVSLTIKDVASSVTTTELKGIEELYVAFFNRVPDADGLAYWIGQFKAGVSLNQIAESFYNAGVAIPSLTGYSADMSNADFVNVVYRNVLGRTSGAETAALNYWSGELASGSQSHGSLVTTILASAHTFKGDPYYGWVSNLLDNKVTVANKCAVDWGLNYGTPEDAISQGMAIAAAVTPAYTSLALELVGVSAQDFLI
jgi:Ca2+-binding RTX toxin-like protein